MVILCRINPGNWFNMSAELPTLAWEVHWYPTSPAPTGANASQQTIGVKTTQVAADGTVSNPQKAVIPAR